MTKKETILGITKRLYNNDITPAVATQLILIEMDNESKMAFEEGARHYCEDHKEYRKENPLQ